MENKSYIVDTTLRDGEQEAGRAFSDNKKLEIARYLDNNNIYQIEAGIPAMGKTEKECILKIKDQCRSSIISTWNRLNIKDINDSFDCNPDIIHLSVPTSDIQIFTNLKKNKIWLEEKLKECIFHAKSKGYEVTIGFEDASRTDETYLIHLCDILRKLDITRVRYADTVGILTPSFTRRAVSRLIEETGIDIEIHAHNDFGMAVAVSLEAVKSGAKYVDCTLEGIGERAGNCNMYEFLKVINRNNIFLEKKIVNY